jgi:polysaccharide deacetylase family protein (PEP-CTERM system associated)
MNKKMPDLSSQSCMLLSFDIEDWFQVENFKPWIATESWSERELRVERNVNRLLDLLDDGFASTFFILGWIAERLPELVRQITARGHEVASHGYGHQMCQNMSPANLRQDLIRSKQLLEDITGAQVAGYRAPSFSISARVLELLEECGYKYDSSYNSFEANNRYGRLDTSRYRANGQGFKISEHFHELPLSNLHFMHRVLPWSGGGYFRLLPYRLFQRGIRTILARQGYYLFYLHPWEIDGDQPRVSSAGRLSRFRHYCNLKSTHAKLRRLLNDHADCRFTTCRDFLQATGQIDTSDHDCITHAHCHPKPN